MTKQSEWCGSIPLTIVLLLVATVASAQEETGSLYGTVIDPNGEPLPGVSVSLTGLGALKVQISDVLGKFRFLGLDPGAWSLEAKLDGFSTVEYPNIDIRAGRNTTVEVQLSAAIGEVITVTSESALLDERKLAQGSILTQLDLEAIPTARDPWAVLNQAPGVLVDRINVGGNESGGQSLFTAPGAQKRDNQFLIDGVEITDLAAVGSSETYYDFEQFAQIELSTGGTEISKLTPGVSINMVTKRGTNELRGAARFLITDSNGYFGILQQSEPKIDPDDLAPGQDENIVGNQVNKVEEVGFEAGGPVWRDRVWLWGAWAQNDIQAVTVDGQDDDTMLENTAVKLNAQITTANSFVGSWNNSNKTKSARGIGPTVELEAAWNQRGPTDITKLEDTHVFGSSFFLSGTWSKVDGRFMVTAIGGVGPGAPEALLDSDGVWKANSGSYSTQRPNEEWKLDGSRFFGIGTTSHELKFGARFREFDVLSAYIFPGRQLWHIAGENWGVDPGPVDFLMAHRSDLTSVSQEYSSAWLQDTLTLGRWTLNAGLRYDLQEGVNNSSHTPANPEFPELLPAIDFRGNDGGGFDWETISPRLGATYALGQERQTLIRASYSRFAEQLGTGDINRVNPVAGAYAYFYFIDTNDNNMWDGREIDGEPDLIAWWGFDPENPTALETPDVIDPALDPATTDEILLGVEHSFRPELVVGLHVTWRNVTDVREDRDFLREEETGAKRLATRDDYFLERTLEGTLPDGRPYATDFYSLLPGFSYTGGSYRTNGDRKKEYLGANLTLTKRLSNQWMLRGYLSYGKTDWGIPDSFFHFDDPTDDRDTWDNDGELFMEFGKRRQVFLQSNGSLNVNGMYQLAPDRPWGFNVAGSVYARQGYPLPYYVRFVSRTDGQGRSAAVGRSDDFRTQDIYTLDLRLEKEFAATGNAGLTFGIDAFNVFSDNYVLRRDLALNGARPDYLNETLSPRIYRLGVRLSWR